MYLKGDPLYAFGHGLSYTTFDYSNLAVTLTPPGPARVAEVSVTVKNAGARIGDEVVQVYARAPDGEIVRAAEQLCGFQRIALQPGESKRVTIQVPINKLAYWDQSMRGFVVQPRHVHDPRWQFISGHSSVGKIRNADGPVRIRMVAVNVSHSRSLYRSGELVLATILITLVLVQSAPGGPPSVTAMRKTVVSVDGGKFKINGQFTYRGRVFDGIPIEGLLMNSRMVQATFDDDNPATRDRWNYPDGPWDADRNTSEFIAALPEFKEKGLLAVTVNLQGGSPEGYSAQQPWINSAFAPDGSLKPRYAARMQRVIDAADDLGMVVILGFFYYGQENKMEDTAAVLRACDAATDWVIDQRYTNVIIEIANEIDAQFKHAVCGRDRAGELIDRVQKRTAGKGKQSC